MNWPADDEIPRMDKEELRSHIEDVNRLLEDTVKMTEHQSVRDNDEQILDQCQRRLNLIQDEFEFRQEQDATMPVKPVPVGESSDFVELDEHR